MSDTDDTDVLLLIPPDFFFVNSDTDSSFDEDWNEHCRFHCNLVENLAGEVGDLKSRLNFIENISISSSVCTEDQRTESEMSNRNFQFTEDIRNHLVPSSTNSTPQKPRTKFVVNSLPSTPSSQTENIQKLNRRHYERKVNSRIMQPIKSKSHHNLQGYNENDADISNYTSSPDKRDTNKEVLGEIDQFLSHVKTIKRFEESKKLDNEFRPGQTDFQSLPISFDNSPLKLSDLKGEGDYKIEKTRNLDLKDIDKLIQSLEKQQQKMERVPITNRVVEGDEMKTQTWKPGETKNSVPDYDYGIREIMYAKDDAEKLASNIDNYLHKQCNQSKNADMNDSDSTNDSTPPTVFENTMDNYLLKKPQNELIINPPEYVPTKKINVFDYVTNSAPQNILAGKPKMLEEVMKKSVQSNIQSAALKHKRSFITETNATNSQMFGLNDLWKQGVQPPQSDHQNIIAKLDEERLRRQHCEKLIQELQLKHLEMQQRLAVAVQVDCAKDAAILKFHKAWEKVSDRWSALEAERNQLTQKLSSIKSKSDQEMAEAKKKMIQYESEMSKALDLAHSNQEKLNTVEFEKNSLLMELETVKKDLDTQKNLFKKVEDDRDELRAKLMKIESDVAQEKAQYTNLERELESVKRKSQNDIDCFQNEIKIIKEERSKMEQAMQETTEAYNSLETKKRSLEKVVEVSKNNEKRLQQEIYKLVEHQDKAKIELRNFYQQQVDVLVKDKLKEFQSQVEQTEKTLHDELHLREQNIAKTAAKQLQKFTDKHQVEIQLLEQKHKEEINLYEIQIQQLKHLIGTQQNKLDHMQMKRNNIAQELKSVMEAQWSEALKIIDYGKTPLSTPSEIKDDLRYQLPEQEKQRETRSIVENAPADSGTPKTSKEAKSWQEQTNDLHKYIKMLLDKEPGNPTEGAIPSSTLRNAAYSDCIDMSSHPEAASQNVEETLKRHYASVSREHRASKPPWK